MLNPGKIATGQYIFHAAVRCAAARNEKLNEKKYIYSCGNIFVPGL
jgi:hypothetical protein